MLGRFEVFLDINDAISGSQLQRVKKLNGQCLDTAIMLLEEMKSGRGSNVTKVMRDLSIGGDSD